MKKMTKKKAAEHSAKVIAAMFAPDSKLVKGLMETQAQVDALVESGEWKPDPVLAVFNDFAKNGDRSWPPRPRVEKK